MQSELKITYRIFNRGTGSMLYSVGAHPAFAAAGAIEDYSLEFDRPGKILRYVLKENLFSGETVEIDLDGNIFALSDELFKDDAIVLKNNTTSYLSLLHREKCLLKVSFDDFPYLGIWKKPGAPFICIEPWQGSAYNCATSGKLVEK